MKRTELIQKLKENQDLGYRDFNASLIPNISKKTIIGVRVPALRKIAQEFYKNSSATELNRFLYKLPHQYFEENQVHLFVISKMNDFAQALLHLENFLPYIDNWAVCDGKSPKVLLTDVESYKGKISQWLKSTHPYEVRFAVNSLMESFMEERFNKSQLEMVASINENNFSDELPLVLQNSKLDSLKMKKGSRPTDRYYVQMVVAWYFATALAKQWDATLPYIKQRRLSPWIHKKTIQKARESFRITDEQKEILLKLR